MIKLLTHTDLDGIGCELLIKLKFGKNNVDVSKCGYHNINSILYSTLKNEKDYDKIYITDISVDEKMAKWIEKDFKHKVVLIDHHPTALWLNRYNWATVKTHINDEVVSATKLVYDNVLEHSSICFKDTSLEDIISRVDEFDTWKWNSKVNLKAKELNDICYILGLDEMSDFLYESVINSNGNTELVYSDEINILLKHREKEYKECLESANKSMITATYKQYMFGLVYSDRFNSELGNDLAKMNPKLDFIAILNMKTGLSLRGVKDNIDLGLIAKEMGAEINCKGGGHPKASGVTLTKEFKLNLFKDVFHCVEE